MSRPTITADFAIDGQGQVHGPFATDAAMADAQAAGWRVITVSGIDPRTDPKVVKLLLAWANFRGEPLPR
jgi:hypothetical protein